MKRISQILIPVAITVFLTVNKLEAQSSEAIRKYTENINAGIAQVIQGELIHSTTLLPEFYFDNGFQSVWTPARQKEVLELLIKAEDHGLNPADYHFNALSLMNKDPMRSQSVDAEVLFTDAFLLYASHFLNGKLDPEEVEGEWQALRREGNAKIFLNNCLTTGNFNELFSELEPSSESYHGLVRELKKYKEILIEGGWPALESGETLKPNMSGVRVQSLKTRLSLEGYFLMEGEINDTYTEELQQAVKAFQLHHGLEADGNVGKQTLGMLNIPVERKIEMIRVNLERLRWINQDLGNHYVLVNIADYTMKVYKQDSMVYRQTVVVGKPFRKTPVFSDQMTYFVLNPYWTVPPTILYNDVLPEVKKNVEYLKTKNMKVLRGGEEVAPETIDWSKLSRNNFPYTIRQEPGATNALGAVKFMFPNKYNIYIHDTPSKELFNRPDRAFSSGCIRLNKPLEFVNYLLTDLPDWNKDKIQSELKNGRDKTVMLKKPLGVHILYLTAWVDENGVQFRNDVYQRDSVVMAALAESAPSLD